MSENRRFILTPSHPHLPSRSTQSTRHENISAPILGLSDDSVGRLPSIGLIICLAFFGLSRASFRGHRNIRPLFHEK